MPEQAPRLMTVDEFLVWEDGTDTYYELDAGVVRPVANWSNTHGTIKASLCGLIGNALRGRSPIHAEMSSVIRIDHDTMWMADLTVNPRLPTHELAEPVLVVEVLAAASRTHDLGRKLPDYVALQYVREVWMVDAERRWVQAWTRNSDAVFAVATITGNAVLESPMLNFLIELDDIYANSGL